MHTMQEEHAPPTSLSSHDFSSSSNGYANGGVGGRYGSSKEGPRLRDTLAAVGGMLIPLLTQFGGHHH